MTKAVNYLSISLLMVHLSGNSFNCRLVLIRNCHIRRKVPCCCCWAVFTCWLTLPSIVHGLLQKPILHHLLCWQLGSLTVIVSFLTTLEKLIIGFGITPPQMQRSCHGGTMVTRLQPWPTEQSLLITTHGIIHILLQLGVLCLHMRMKPMKS